MSWYEFGAGCPRCGTPLEHEASSKPTDAGRRVSSIVKCPKPRCCRRFQIVTELLDFSDCVPLPAPLKEDA